MNIFGIDPAARSVAVFGTSGRHAPCWGVKLTTAKANRDRELKDLRRQLEEMVRFMAEAIFIEEPVVAGARNIRSTILIAETVGMVLAIPDVPIYLVEISTWKKLTVGKGNATKDDVSSWLSREHPDYAAICEGDQDLIDAGAINVYGRQIMGSLR